MADLFVMLAGCVSGYTFIEATQTCDQCSNGQPCTSCSENTVWSTATSPASCSRHLAPGAAADANATSMRGACLLVFTISWPPALATLVIVWCLRLLLAEIIVLSLFSLRCNVQLQQQH